MKKFLTIIPLVILLCFAFGCQQGEEMTEEVGVKALSDEDVAAIKAATEEYIQAVNSDDSAATAALYTENAVLMPPNESMIQGRAAIQTWEEAGPITTEFNLTVEEIDGRGDLAFVRGTYSITVVLEGAPEPIQDTGKYVEIRRKQPDSSWLIAVDIFNSDLPLPE